MGRSQTLELKSKKIVGNFSCGKDKQRITLVVTACSNGELLPPFLIFKTAKPRNKTLSDHPTNEIPSFDQETRRLMSRHGVEAVQNFTAFNRSRIMSKFWIPYYVKNAYPGSLLTFDNHSSHVCDATSSALDDEGVHYLNLPANTTPICQPVDIQIGADLKAKIKSYYENWLLEKRRAHNL